MWSPPRLGLARRRRQLLDLKLYLLHHLHHLRILLRYVIGDHLARGIHDGVIAMSQLVESLVHSINLTRDGADPLRDLLEFRASDCLAVRDVAGRATLLRSVTAAKIP